MRHWLNSRRESWNGARWADFESDSVTLEHKAGEQVPKTLRNWWAKLAFEAHRDGKEPILVLDTPDGKLAVVRAEAVLLKAKVRAYGRGVSETVGNSGWGVRDLREAAERETAIRRSQPQERSYTGSSVLPMQPFCDWGMAGQCDAPPSGGKVS